MLGNDGLSFVKAFKHRLDSHAQGMLTTVSSVSDYALNKVEVDGLPSISLILHLE